MKPEGNDARNTVTNANRGDVYNAFGVGSIGRYHESEASAAQVELLSFVQILQSRGLLDENGLPASAQVVQTQAIENKDKLKNLRRAIENGTLSGVEKAIGAAGPLLVAALKAMWG